MPTFRLVHASCLLVLAFTACSSSPSPLTDGGVADAGDAGVGDAGVGDAGDAAPHNDASVCSGTMSIGSGGGTLTVCDAVLAVASGVLTSDIVFGIEQVELVDVGLGLPFEMAQTAPAYRFTPTDVVLPGLVSVSVPAGTNTRAELAYAGGDATNLNPMERCMAEDGQLQQFMLRLGVFGAIEYPGMPASSTGLGSGTFSISFDSMTHAYAFETTEMTATFVRMRTGGRAISLFLPKTDYSTIVRFIFSQGATGGDALTHVSWMQGVNGAGYTDGMQSGGTITLEPDTGDDHVRGTFVAPAEDGSGTTHMATGTFDVVPEWFTFGLEAGCNGE